LYYPGRFAVVAMFVVGFLVVGSIAAKVCLNKIPLPSSPPDLVPASAASPRLLHPQDLLFLVSPPLLTHPDPHSSASTTLQICSTQSRPTSAFLLIYSAL
jgi:hypothetical protein